jgi:hypothetical protein
MSITELFLFFLVVAALVIWSIALGKIHNDMPEEANLMTLYVFKKTIEDHEYRIKELEERLKVREK